MNLNKLVFSCVLGLFVSAHVFASEQKGVNFFDENPMQEKFVNLEQDQKPCALPCQLAKECIELYNERYQPENRVFMPEKDEVQNPDLRAQIKRLAEEISFIDDNGQLIQPIPHEKKPGCWKLPLGKQCQEFKNAKAFLEELPSDYQPVDGSSTLAFDFKARKRAGFYASYCTISSSSSVFSIRQPKRSRTVGSSVGTELDERN